MSKRNLLLFTNSSTLNGAAKSWFSGEIEFFKLDYNITIYVSGYLKDGIIIGFEDFNVIRLDKLFHYSPIFFSISFFKTYFIIIFKEFFNERVFSKKYWFKSWLNSIKIALAFYKINISKDWVHLDRDSTVIYFYWGNDATMLIPIFKKMGFNKIISRFHGFDLYKERLGGYQPFKTMILENLSSAITISNHGKIYLEKTYPFVNFNCNVFHLGTTHRGFSTPLNDNKLRLISCSSLIELKQVSLIASAVVKSEIPIEWVHIGVGPEYRNVLSVMKQKKNNPSTTCELKGWIEPEDISNFYSQSNFDLFINASTTEGIPVSIMEAFAAKIPVIAPNVGGIPEIVIDQFTGFLLNNMFTEDELLKVLYYYFYLSKESKETLRTNAFHLFQENYNLTKNSKDFKFFIDTL
jgi:colanic acid/amylovoran biosynthesis glycosyltransferase